MDHWINYRINQTLRIYSRKYLHSSQDLHINIYLYNRCAKGSSREKCASYGWIPDVVFRPFRQLEYVTTHL